MIYIAIKRLQPPLEHSVSTFWFIGGGNNLVTMPEPTELESDIEDPAGICSKSRALHILHGQLQPCRERRLSLSVRLSGIVGNITTLWSDHGKGCFCR